MTGVQTCALPISIDQKFFELIVPIATFLTGTLSGIMLAGNDKEAQKIALQAATRPTTVSPMPTPPSTPSPSFSVPTPITPIVSTPVAPTTINTPTPDFTPQVVTSSTGKPMAVQPPQPEI